MDEKKYETVSARGEVRVLARDDERVGLNVFGTYALLSPTAARDLGFSLIEAADRVQYGDGA